MRSSLSFRRLLGKALEARFERFPVADQVCKILQKIQLEYNGV